MSVAVVMFICFMGGWCLGGFAMYCICKSHNNKEKYARNY